MGLTGLPGNCQTLMACNSLSEVRRLVLHNAGDKVLCHDDPDIPSFETFKENGNGYGGQFDRQGRMACKSFHSTKGDVVTAFSFSAALWDVRKNPFPQHTILFGYFRPSATSDHRLDFMENYSVVEQ